MSAIKRRKRFGAYNRNGNTSSGVLRIHYKQEKEHADSVTCTGISRFSIRHSHHKIKVPELKVKKLIQRIKQALSSLPRSCRWIAGLLGKITAMLPAVGEALLHIRHLQRSLAISLTQRNYDWESQCHLSTLAMEELMWWKQFVTKKNGLPIHKIQMKKPKIITTDSSDTGWETSSPIMQT